MKIFNLEVHIEKFERRKGLPIMKLPLASPLMAIVIVFVFLIWASVVEGATPPADAGVSRAISQEAAWDSYVAYIRANFHEPMFRRSK